MLQTHRECPEVQALPAEMLYFPQFQELPRSQERNAVVFGLLDWNQHLHKKMLDKSVNSYLPNLSINSIVTKLT